MSYNKEVNQSIYQSINQLINQSNNQSLHQSPVTAEVAVAPTPHINAFFPSCTSRRRIFVGVLRERGSMGGGQERGE